MSLINDKWELLFDKYNIEKEVEKNGLFYITAEQIREFKEPRLMTKFDTKESLPPIFGKLAILPVTRGKYAIGQFDLYKDFPETKPDITKLTSAKIPDYFQTIDINDIRSEANAINVMSIAGIIDDFLQEPEMVQTVSGRMSSGNFSFRISNGRKDIQHTIEVQNSQIEIDGGFENQNIFTIVEGKNVVHDNFLIRQLYYPTRLWNMKIEKLIRPVFMVYSNNIFRLLEYEFTDINNYGSIILVKEKNYTLEDAEITLEDLKQIHTQVTIKKEPTVTFIQADSFNKVISLMENLNEKPMSINEIAELFGFKERQSDYYFNACKYLGLAEKKKEDDISKVFITNMGKSLLKLTYRKRQLEYVKLILQHKIFNEMFDVVLKTGEIPEKRFIANRMHELSICSENLIDRRASSVSGWLKWIINLIN